MQSVTWVVVGMEKITAIVESRSQEMPQSPTVPTHSSTLHCFIRTRYSQLSDGGDEYNRSGESSAAWFVVGMEKVTATMESRSLKMLQSPTVHLYPSTLHCVIKTRHSG